MAVMPNDRANTVKSFKDTSCAVNIGL